MTSTSAAPKVDFDPRDPAVMEASSAVPLTFVRDASGSVSSTYSGIAVYVDGQSEIEIQPGETYFVRLDDKRIESDCYYAVPMKKVGADFFLEMSVSDRMKFLHDVFMHGGKPSKELLEAIERCSPEICERLSKGGELLMKNCELNNTAAMYKGKLDNANATIRQRDAEISKLREKLAQKSAKATGKEEAVALRKALADSEAKVAEMEMGRKELADGLAEAERSRDTALKEMDEKDRLIDALSRKLSEFRRSSAHPEESIPVYTNLFRPGVTIRRDSERTISSDWFTSPRYKVLMSGDMKRIRIVPDSEGGVECRNYTLSIPKLESVSHFTSVAYLRAEFAPDMSSVEVVL